MSISDFVQLPSEKYLGFLQAELNELCRQWEAGDDDALPAIERTERAIAAEIAWQAQRKLRRERITARWQQRKLCRQQLQ